MTNETPQPNKNKHPLACAEVPIFADISS